MYQIFAAWVQKLIGSSFFLFVLYNLLQLHTYFVNFEHYTKNVSLTKHILKIFAIILNMVQNMLLYVYSTYHSKNYIIKALFCYICYKFVVVSLLNIVGSCRCFEDSTDPTFCTLISKVHELYVNISLPKLFLLLIQLRNFPIRHTLILLDCFLYLK